MIKLFTIGLIIMPIIKGQSEWLINRLSALGYPLKEGLCFGMANLGEIAFLLGSLDALDARLIKVSDSSTQYFQVASQALQHSSLKNLDPFLTECLAFFDALAIYQAPTSYKELFDVEMEQSHIRQVDWLLPKIMSGRRTECSKFSGVYDLTALQAYLDLIKQNLDENQVLLTSLILECADHALQIGYDSTKKQWTIVEVNNLPTEVTDNTKDLAFKIFASFYNGDEEPSSIPHNEAISIFSTTISVNAREHETALHALFQLEKSPQWQAIHIPTPEKTAALDSIGSNWLYLACGQNDAHVVANILAQAGVNVNQKNITGHFPLSIACLRGHFEVVRLLLSHPDIDLETTTNDSSTALLIACQHGHNQIIQLFGERPDIKALLNSRDPDGFSPLDCAVREGNVDLVRILRSMDEALDVNHKDEDGETVIFIACRSGNNELLVALSEFAGVDYKLANNTGMTPFMVAFKNGHLWGAKWLVEQKQVDTFSVDANRTNALIHAVEAEQADIVNYLLSLSQLEIDHQDINDDTAFTLACRQENIDFALALINRGCNIELKNIEDETGFDILIRKNKWQEFFSAFNAARAHHPNPSLAINPQNKAIFIYHLQRYRAALSSVYSIGLFAQPQPRPADRADENTLSPPKRVCIEGHTP